MKIIESWGTGIKRIFSSCKECGIREPELLEIGNSFRVTLYRPFYNEGHQSILKSEPESIPKNLNKTQKKIIDIIWKNPKVTQTEIAEQMNIFTSAVKKSMKKIGNVGILARIGANKGGYWEVRYK